VIVNFELRVIRCVSEVSLQQMKSLGVRCGAGRFIEV
jgi:hypothetical protein